MTLATTDPARLGEGEFRVTLGDGRSWGLVLATLSNVEVHLIEEQAGWYLWQWVTELRSGSIKAITILVWLVMRRDDNPMLDLAEVEFPLAHMNFEAGEGEADPKAAPGTSPPPPEPQAPQEI